MTNDSRASRMISFVVSRLTDFLHTPSIMKQGCRLWQTQPANLRPPHTGLLDELLFLCGRQTYQVLKTPARNSPQVLFRTKHRTFRIYSKKLLLKSNAEENQQRFAQLAPEQPDRSILWDV